MKIENIKNPRTYKKADFRKGDFIVFEYAEKSFVKGEIVDLKENTAIIEIALPTKKSDQIETDTFEVEYSEIIPIAAIVLKEVKTV